MFQSLFHTIYMAVMLGTLTSGLALYGLHAWVLFKRADIERDLIIGMQEELYRLHKEEDKTRWEKHTV